MATITVRGTASAGATPDEAALVVELTELRPTSEEAYLRVAELSAALDALFDELGIDPSRRSSRGVSVGEHTEYVDGRREHRGHAVTARVALRLDDSAVVARVVREAVARTGARVEGPRWLVRSDNPARQSAAREAAAAARRQAEAYAEALGMRLGTIERAAEPGLDPTPRLAEMELRHMALGASADGPEILVEPGELRVSASIDVTFFLMPL